MRLGIAFSGEGLTLAQTVAYAERAEAAGFDSAWAVERWRSAIVPAVAIGLRTRRLRVGTGIALAFTRSPALLALEALDAASATGGRFILGIGAGPRQTIEGLHGTRADRPAGRMREYVEALRLLLAARHGEAVRYRGEFLTVDGSVARGEAPTPPVPIYIAAVNPAMLRVAGGFGDGWIGSTITSPRYLREVAHPELARGAARRGRPGMPATASFLVTSVAERREEAIARARPTIAHYCRLDYYDGVLTLHGFEATPIREALCAGDNAAAARAVSDAMLEELAIVGTPAECREKLCRYDGLLDTAILYPPTGGLSQTETQDVHERLLEAFAGWRADP